MPINTYRDKELISLLEQKNKKGFEKLYTQFAGALYGIIKDMIHDELTAGKLLEDTFVCAWAGVEQYKRQEQSFFIWLLSICRYVCKQYLKGEMPGAGKIDNKENVNYRLIIEMIQGHSYEDVAKTMNIPASIVLSQAKVGLQSFKKGTE